MPACTIEQHNGMTVCCNIATDLGEMQVHGLAIRHGEDEGCSDISCGTDGTEQIGPALALIARSPRPAAALGPDACQRALLADAGFVLPPQFDQLVAYVRRDAGSDQIGEVFLCASWSAISCSGHRGRTDRRRKPQRRSRSPTDRSASLTP